MDKRRLSKEQKRQDSSLPFWPWDSHRGNGADVRQKVRVARSLLSRERGSGLRGDNRWTSRDYSICRTVEANSRLVVRVRNRRSKQFVYSVEGLVAILFALIGNSI